MKKKKSKPYIKPPAKKEEKQTINEEKQVVVKEKPVTVVEEKAKVVETDITVEEVPIPEHAELETPLKTDKQAH